MIHYQEMMRVQLAYCRSDCVMSKSNQVNFYLTHTEYYVHKVNIILQYCFNKIMNIIHIVG